MDPVAALRAVALGTSDLLRPRIWGVVLAGVALTLGLFILLQAGAFWLLRDVAPAEVALPFGWSLPLASALSWGSLALFPLMSIFLMAPVAAGFSGLFSDRVFAMRSLIIGSAFALIPKIRSTSVRKSWKGPYGPASSGVSVVSPDLSRRVTALPVRDSNTAAAKFVTSLATFSSRRPTRALD